MITVTSTSLGSHSVKELGRLAEKLGLGGWKSLKKNQLLSAIVKAARKKAKSKPVTVHKTVNKRLDAKAVDSTKKTKSPLHVSKLGTTNVTRADTKTTSNNLPDRKPIKRRNPRITERIQKANAERVKKKDLSQLPVSQVRANGQYVKPQDTSARNGRLKMNGKMGRDRIVLMVRDAYWLHAYWEVTRQSVQRAQAAMAEQWHSARPVLRVIEVDAGATTSAAERVSREIFIHGGVTNWYIDVPNPPRSFRVDIGYLSTQGKFYSLARSNVVSTPNPGGVDETDPHWTDVAENFEKIYALSGGFSDDHTTGDLQDLFEERLRRPMKSSTSAGFGVGAERALKRERDFRFDIDAEMLIFGHTKPGGHVTIGGAPVKVKSDGSFSVRLAMPDKRQVLPLVARSSDGVEHRTIVLAIERNTKIMEPMIREGGE